jgi:hypothetical protein
LTTASDDAVASSSQSLIMTPTASRSPSVLRSGMVKVIGQRGPRSHLQPPAKSKVTVVSGRNSCLFVLDTQRPCQQIRRAIIAEGNSDRNVMAIVAAPPIEKLSGCCRCARSRIY